MRVQCQHPAVAAGFAVQSAEEWPLRWSAAESAAHFAEYWKPMEEYPEADGKAKSVARIPLMVKGRQGKELQVKIKKSTPLRKLIDAYCSHFGSQASQARLMIDGEFIAPGEAMEMLRLADGDLIDVAAEGSDAARGKRLLFLAAGCGGCRMQRMSVSWLMP